MWLVINQLGSPWFYEKFDIFKCPHQGLKINVIYVWPLNRTPARSHRRRFFPSDSASEKSKNLGGEGHKELEGLLRTRFYFWFCQNGGGGTCAPLTPVSAGPVHRKTTTGPILDPDLSAQAFGNQPTFPCLQKNQEKTETSVPISFKCSELLKISLGGLVVNTFSSIFV